jgi:hypothetical protein
MKIAMFFPAEHAFHTLVLIVVSALAGTGVAAAQTYRHGNSTAIIEQSGGSATSDSQVRQYRNGQTIITENGNSTDITTQREADRSTAAGNHWHQYPQDYFFRRRFEERFSQSYRNNRRSDFRRHLEDRFSGYP